MPLAKRRKGDTGIKLIPISQLEEAARSKQEREARQSLQRVAKAVLLSKDETKKESEKKRWGGDLLVLSFLGSY